MQRAAVLLLLGVAVLPAQTESPAVVGVGPFMHIVSDLDRSLAFYQDKLGLVLSGPPGEHKFTDNPAVANLYGVPGKQFRAAVLKIPGSEIGIELVQWGDLGSPLPLSDYGYAELVLFRPNAELRQTVLQDPDGLPVGIGRAESLAVNLAVTADDIPKTIALYEKVLGFKADGHWLSIPGTSLRMHLGETRTSDVYNQPSRAMLRLRVRNIDVLTASLKSAGFSVITTGGAPVTLPQGPQVIILRDPNNFYLQLMEAR
jgi:catechol 2,3-dioxygenase-like lactoylglutathione lyase family enzyme